MYACLFVLKVRICMCMNVYMYVCKNMKSLYVSMKEFMNVCK